VALTLFVAAIASPRGAAATAGAIQSQQKASPAMDATQLLEALDRLVEHNRELEKQNRELMDQIESLRGALARQAQASAGAKKPARPPAVQGTAFEGSAALGTQKVEAAVASEEGPKKWGRYTPNLGYKVADTKHGDLSISIYTYGRYLNQRGLDNTYTDAFGKTINVQQRQDYQIQKVQNKFLGWILDPKFRYFLYGWTSNANQGLDAQVVLAGNLNYSFSKLFTFSAGITSLPGTRSVEGNFPFWLGVDSRHIADEFFRPSYTSGMWARGDITKTLRYQIMIGNNLSTLGVAASQLDPGFNTVASALVWMPTTGEFGPGFGDFEDHQELATRLGGHFTRSNETRESQPSSNQFENTQIRLSDGSVIFTPELFGPGITITDVRYRMATLDGGIKYRGMAIEAEYFWRWLDDFEGPGTAGLASLFDHGFQLQTSAMLVPKTFQLYLGGSKIFGQFGNPWDARFGANWFPMKNKVIRVNNELLYLYRSPAGYTSVPFAVGGRGFVFHSNLEMAF
jgi:hypothetical protein